MSELSGATKHAKLGIDSGNGLRDPMELLMADEASEQLREFQREERAKLFHMLDELQKELQRVHVELTEVKVRLESQDRMAKKLDHLERNVQTLREESAASKAIAQRSVLVAVITAVGAVATAILAAM